MIASLERKYSPAEYLDLETQVETRNEYRSGEIIPMTGGTPNHNRLSGALNALLWLQLRGQPYSVFITDQRLWIPDRYIYTYPDIMVLSKPIALQEGRKDTVVNPILIAEVLSDSTSAYDSPEETLRKRGEKFAAYRTIGSFQEYLLIDQYKVSVEQYIRQAPNQWLFTEYTGLEEKFMISAIGVEIALADLYEGVEF